MTPVEAQSGRCGVRAVGGQGLPPVGREDLLVGGPGQSCVGDAGRAPQVTDGLGVELAEPCVDLGVDARHEERRDGVDRGEVVTVGLGLLQPGQERVHDPAVAVDAEDQRDVDADALGEDLGDRGQPGEGRRDLDEGVRAVDEPPQTARLRDGGGRVVGQARVDLDRDASVRAAAGVVGRAHDVAGPPDVVRRQRTHGLLHGDLALGQVPDLVGVGLAVGERLLEDRRVGRDPDDPAVGDHRGQRAACEAGAAEVVQPDGDTVVGQGGDRGAGHDVPPGESARLARAAATTAAAVSPNSR